MRKPQKNPEFDSPGTVSIPDRSPTTRILQAQDEERRKIGRELHDSVGQALVAIKMSVAKLRQDRAIEDYSALDRIMAALDDTIAEIRTISHLLHPPDLELMGLRASLAWYVQGFRQRTGIETDFEAPAELPFLPPSVSTVLFRVAQEALTNIHKHAQASRVALRLVVDDRELRFEISDNGRGFADLDSCRQGVGILGMQERIAEHDGTLRIESGHGVGSSVRATIPLSAETPAHIAATSVAGGIRVLIVDDHPAIRYGVRTVLTAQPDIIVCGEASTVAEAVQRAEKLVPDVMILDLKLGDQNGWSVVTGLRDNNPAIKILIFSYFEERYFANSAYRAGCYGALSKTCDGKVLIEAIRIIHAGGKFFPAKGVARSA